jgi:hypothetical protein
MLDDKLLANRRNASLSTAPPRTLDGKLRSRSNAIKHGLTARTVVGDLEVKGEFQLFRKKIAAAYRHQTFLDHELIDRLAVLLWRLRRANAIETGILSIQANIQLGFRRERGRLSSLSELSIGDPVQLAHAFPRASNLNEDVLDRLTRPFGHAILYKAANRKWGSFRNPATLGRAEWRS